MYFTGYSAQSAPFKMKIWTFREVIIPFLFITITFSVTAQYHLSEKRIGQKKVPPQILEYIQENHSSIPVKYYRLQTLGDSTQYEVKIKSKETTVDLIFDKKGNLIRKDIIVPPARFSASVKEKINDYLKARFTTYSIDYYEILCLKEELIYGVKLRAKEKALMKVFSFRFDANGLLMDFKEFPKMSLDPVFH